MGLNRLKAEIRKINIETDLLEKQIKEECYKKWYRQKQLWTIVSIIAPILIALGAYLNNNYYAWKNYNTLKKIDLDKKNIESLKDSLENQRDSLFLIKSKLDEEKRKNNKHSNIIEVLLDSLTELKLVEGKKLKQINKLKRINSFIQNDELNRLKLIQGETRDIVFKFEKMNLSNNEKHDINKIRKETNLIFSKLQELERELFAIELSPIKAEAYYKTTNEIIQNLLGACNKIIRLSGVQSNEEKQWLIDETISKINYSKSLLKKDKLN